MCPPFELRKNASAKTLLFGTRHSQIIHICQRIWERTVNLYRYVYTCVYIYILYKSTFGFREDQHFFKNPSYDAWKLLGTATCLFDLHKWPSGPSSPSPPESFPGVSCFQVSRWRWTSPCRETWDSFRGKNLGIGVSNIIKLNWSESVYISWMSKQIQIRKIKQLQKI